MQLLLQRKHGLDFTPGKLYLDGQFFCQTMEDKERDVKVFGETAIPTGTYKVDLTYSPHFGMTLPILLNVPNFSGVRIHSGNTTKDTEGCILVGMDNNDSDSWLGGSRLIFGKLFVQLQAAVARDEDIFITIQ